MNTYYNLKCPSTDGGTMTLEHPADALDYIEADLENHNWEEPFVVSITPVQMTEEQFEALGEFQP